MVVAKRLADIIEDKVDPAMTLYRAASQTVIREAGIASQRGIGAGEEHIGYTEIALGNILAAFVGEDAGW